MFFTRIIEFKFDNNNNNNDDDDDNEKKRSFTKLNSALQYL